MTANTLRRMVLCAVLLTMLGAGVCSAQSSRYLYWVEYMVDADSLVVSRMRLDGSAVETIPIPGYTVTHIAYDRLHHALYWIGRSTDIARAYIDIAGRSSPEGGDADSLTFASCGIGNGTDIVLDPPRERMYLAYTGDCAGYIDVMRLDGSDRQRLPIRVAEPSDVAIDTAAGKLYWIEQYYAGSGQPRVDGIYRSEIDGSNQSRLSIMGSVVVPDEANESLFLVTNGNQIFRSGIEGENATAVLTDSSRIGDLYVDEVDKKLYWSSSGRIRRANLDGTGVEDVLTGLTSSPTSILIADLSPVREDSA